MATDRRLADPTEAPFGALEPPQVVALLRYLRAVIPLGNVTTDSSLFSRVLEWLKLARVDPVVAEELRLTARDGATQSPAVAAQLVRIAASARLRDTPNAAVQALGAVVAANPTAVFDPLAEVISARPGDGAVLLVRVGCAGGVLPAEQTTRLLTLLIDKADASKSVFVVLKAAMAICVLLPHSIPIGNSLADAAMRGGVVRLLSWPRAGNSAPLSSYSGAGDGTADARAESAWIGGLLNLTALSLLQTVYWSYPIEALACARGLAKTAPTSAIERVHGWLMETPLHPRLFDNDSTDIDRAASAAFVYSQCASRDGLAMVVDGRGDRGHAHTETRSAPTLPSMATTQAPPIDVSPSQIKNESNTEAAGAAASSDSSVAAAEAGTPAQAIVGPALATGGGAMASEPRWLTVISNAETGDGREEDPETQARALETLVSGLRDRAKARRGTTAAQSGPVESMLLQVV